jgi:hypothetical protein
MKLFLYLAAGLLQIQFDGLSRDERLMRELRAGGVVERRTRATVWFEDGAVEPRERKELADLVDRGIRNLEKYLGGPYPWQKWQRPKIEYFVSGRIGVSRMNADLGPFVMLSLGRVRAKDAPYLHETVHVLMAGKDERGVAYPMWREEGFASFVADEVVRKSGGWHFAYMTHGGNATVHGECAELLADSQTSGVDSYIGTGGRPSGREMWARSAPGGVAPARRAMYVCGQSYVKFLVDRYGLKTVMRLFAETDSVEGQRRVFGKPVDQLRQEWHGALQR